MMLVNDTCTMIKLCSLFNIMSILVEYFKKVEIF